MAIIKKLCDISKFKINHPKYEVAQEKIGDKITETLKEHAFLTNKNGPIVKDDIVYVTFTGLTSTGENFKGSEGNNIAGIIGGGDFMPEFEEQLMGHYKADKFDITVTPEENHHFQEVVGKKLIFNVTINKITYNKLPDLNNIFVKQLNTPNLNTVDDFIRFIEESINIEHLIQLDNISRNIIINRIIDDSEFEITEDEVNAEVKKVMKVFENKLFYQGLVLADYLRTQKMSKVDLKRKYRDEALKNIKVRTVISHLVDNLNIEVFDDELVNEAKKLDLEYGYSINELIEMGAGKKETFRSDLKRKKVMDILLERAEVTFV